MPWYAWFALALVITVFAAVTGIKAKGTRPVARTQLMGVARWFLLLIVLVIAYQAYRAYSVGQ
jgi:putative effector of murein hydrolase